MISKHMWLGMTLLTSGLSLSAAPVTFDFTAANSSNAPFGNSLVFTGSDGVTQLTATAWGVTGSSNTTFQTGQIFEYSGLGLGACNQDEGLGPSNAHCDPPAHQVSNSNGQDFILFQITSGQTFTVTGLDALVTILTAGDGAHSSADTDVTYYLRNGSTSFSGDTLAGLGSAGFGAAQTADCPAVSNNPALGQSGAICNGIAGTMAAGTRTFALLPGGTYNSILIGAKTGDTNDFFKINSLTINEASVPEPATMSLIGGALLGLGIFNLRRKNRW